MEEFQPIWNENTLRGVIKQYDSNPAGHPENIKQLISQHAQYYNIPFFEGEFSVADALGDFGKGFFAGFTTYDAWEPSDNEYEAIFRNLGHLAGFAPGIIGVPLGAAAKLTRAAGLVGSTRGLLKAAQFARKMNDKSIPMAAAKWSTNKAKKLVGPFFRQGGKAKHDAVKTASNFLLGPRAANIAEGAFHLGVASSVSSWQGGIDQMMSSFVSGGIAGGGFRAIGEFINVGGESANLIARRLAGSLFMGLPETVRGATTPEQVYAYTMGAWFGGQEQGYKKRQAKEFMGEYMKDAQAKDAPPALKVMFDPEIHPKWKNLSEEVKPVVKELFEKELKTKAHSEAALLYFIEEQGLDIDKLDIDVSTPEGKTVKQVLNRMRKLGLFDTQDIEKGSLNDSVVGEKPTESLTLGKRVDNIFRTYMDKVKNPILDELNIEVASDKISKKNEITAKINTLMAPYLKEVTGTAINESEVFVKDLQEMLLKDYKYQIDSDKIPQLSGDIRQWISRRNNNYPQPTLTTDGKDVWTLTEKNPKNRAGNKKVKYEPYKLIDYIYQNITGKDGWAHISLDNITFKNEKGTTKEYDLTQFLKEPTKKDSYGGKKDYMDMISNTMKRMDNSDISEAYYYFGGNGAKKRLLFTRHHPDSNKIKLSEIKDYFNSVNYNKIRDKFVEQFGMSEEYFDKAFKSNVLWGLEMNGMQFSRENMLKILSPQFIVEAVNFNKRNQVWMTDSYPGEKEFFTNKKSTGYVSDLSKDGNFKYSIFPDYHQNESKEVQAKWKKDSAYLDAKSNQMEEHFDGGPVVRDDILLKLNLDAGTYHDITQNKAFILSPDAGRGALLGKLMFHSAGKAQSEQMRKDGVHFYLPKSAIKQMGVRDYNVNYELDPAHIKYNYGVKQTSDYIKPQTLKKQILASLIQRLAFNPKLVDGTTVSEIVEDMKKTLIDARYNGNKESNESLDAYHDKLTTASDKELAKELDEIDFDKVGIEQLLSALRKDGNQIFAKKFYDEMLRGRKADLQEELESGNITDEIYKSSINEIEEYNSLADRMMASAAREAKKRGTPLNQVGIHHHHFMNKFRQKVLSSWVLRQVTKPKVDNSGVARIRPYDYALQTDADNNNKRLIELNTNDELFFLDSAYKKMWIETDILGRKRLEQLWEIYEDKKTPDETKAYLESVFRSGVMRVPMDSSSGLQVLKFAGFTGRKGHGILMHSRAMRALGGADLDGDTAYFYMGGKGGFKKSWLDMFEAQKGEFYETGDRKPIIPPVQNKLSKTAGISIQRDSIYGNPFVAPDVYDKSPSYYKKKGFVRADNVKEAIERYDAWVRGKGDINYLPAKRDKILSNIKEGKLTGKTLKYFKPEAEDSHAVRLVRLIPEISKQPTKPDLPAINLTPLMNIRLKDPIVGRTGVEHYKNIFTDTLKGRFKDLKDLIKDTGKVDFGKKYAAWYGDIPYTYTGIRHKAQKMPAEFEIIARQIEEQMGVEKGYFNSALVNWFPKGKGIGAHSDYEPIYKRDDKTAGKVATVSLGGESKITIKGKKGTVKADIPIEEYNVKSGDIYIMPGKKFQRRHTHEVERTNAERISMTFRHIPKKHTDKITPQLKDVKPLTKLTDLTKLKRDIDILKQTGDVKPRVDLSNTRLSNAKAKKYEDALTESYDVRKPAEKLEQDLLKSPEAAFSPNYRFNASHGSMTGREMLGGAAVMPKQIMGNAYEIISAKGSETIYTSDRWNDYEFTLTPRTSETAKREIAKLMRAAVGISADSSNYYGYKSFDTWYKKMLNTHFTIDYSKNGKKMSREALEKYIEKKGTSIFRYNGTIGDLNDANRAFYGKDYTHNKQWTMEERKNLSENLASMPEEAMTTIMPKISKMLNGVNYSDNILMKIDADKMTAVFNEYNKARSSFDYLKKALGRDTFAVPTGKYINDSLKHELVNPKKLIEIADIDNPDYTTGDANDIKFRSIIEGTPYEYIKREGVKRGGLYQRKIQKKKDLAEYPTTASRIKVLNNIKESAADFLLKDIENVISVIRVAKVANRIKEKNPDISINALNEILADAHRHSEWLKVNSYLMRDSRNQGDRDIELSKNQKIKTKGTAELDQNEIDIEIRKWKKGKSRLEKELLDEFMLGSLNRGSIRELEALKAESVKRKLTNKESLKLDQLREDAARTSSSRLGFSSEALEKRSNRTPKVMDEFIGDINDVLNETLKQRAPEHIRAESKVLVQEPQKTKNIIKGFPEKSERRIEDIIYVNTTGWEGVKKFKKTEVDPETKVYIDDIVHHLKVEPQAAKHFGFLVRKLLQKDINLLNHQDWRVMRDWFNDTKNGTIWQRLKKGELFTKLSQRHYMLMPETVNRELMRDEIKIMQEDGVFLTEQGMRMGKIGKPTQFVDYVQDGIRMTGEASSGLGDELASDLNKKLMYLDTLVDGIDLHQVAVVQRNLSEIKRIMSQEGEQNLKWGKAQSYQELHDNIMKTSDYENSLKNKEYNITLPDGKPNALTGKQIVERINQTYEDYFGEMHKLAIGNVKTDSKGNILKYKVKDSDEKEVYVIADSILEGIEGFTSGPKGSGYIVKSKEFPTGFYDPLTKQNPVINIEKFSNDLRKAWIKGNPIPKEFGVDGMNKIVRSMIIEMASKSKEFTKKELQKIQNTSLAPTGRIPNYWPHMHLNKNAALKALSKYSEHLRKSDLSDKETSEILKNLTYRHHALTGDWNFKDIDDMQELNGILHSISDSKTKQERKIKWLNNLNKPGSTQARDIHIPGFSLDREVPISYGKGLVNSYFRQMAQVFSRDGINRFEKSMFKKGVEPEQRKAWTNWLKLYVQGAIGNPDVIPESILNDPTMKIKGTPYAWFADNVVRDRINKIGEKLGILDKNIPENLRGLDFNDLKWWSNLEARFELASLLAHPKSVVNNIFGGTMHTIQSIGFRNWRNARNNKHMASINPEFSTPQGRDNFAVRQGIYPEQLMEEYGLNTAYQSVKNKKFIKDVASAFTRDPSLSSESVLDIAKRVGIRADEKITRFAAKFMSVPERALRRDAFMSHWLHWYNKFGGAIKDFDHPILVELAKKGVKATQFLYSAPFRPMFSRTALGKVMTRFQTWGWNAVRFRNDTLREAKIYGFKGDAGEKAARMMQMDLFVFALANSFAYSLFEVAMPAPWNWMQDTADWIFGDEKARNRAFMGTWPRALAPLQITTPPILRLPMSSMRAILEDDWERVSGYYIHTMYPFGRISRDFIGPNNLIDNPHGLMDKWTGLPFQKLNKLSKERRKRKERGEEIYIPTPGAGLF